MSKVASTLNSVATLPVIKDEESTYDTDRVVYRVHDADCPIGNDLVYVGNSKRRAEHLFERLAHALITGGHRDEMHYRLLEWKHRDGCLNGVCVRA